MIRAIVSDLDGTILCHGDGGVSVPGSFNLAHAHLTEVLRIPVYPATGRSLHSAEAALNLARVGHLVQMKPGVYNDGRLIYATDTPKPTTEMAFDWALADATYAWLKDSMTVAPGQWGWSVMARCGQMSFFDDGSFPYQDCLVKDWQEKSYRVKDLEEVRLSYDATVLEFTLVGEPEALDQIQKRFDKTFPHLDRAYMRGIHGLWLRHISLHTQNKAEGVKELCRLLELGEDEVLVIGDEYNDKEMLRHFPHSIAMGNAPDEVKECARLVGPACQDDGWSTAVLDYVSRHNSAQKDVETDLDTTETVTTLA